MSIQVLLFKDLNILKFQDIVFLYVAQLMHQYYNNTLPLIFTDFFTPVKRVHTYNTRLASKSTYFMPRVKTNFGKFNIRFLMCNRPFRLAVFLQLILLV